MTEQTAREAALVEALQEVHDYWQREAFVGEESDLLDMVEATLTNPSARAAALLRVVEAARELKIWNGYRYQGAYYESCCECGTNAPHHNGPCTHEKLKEALAALDGKGEPNHD
ncbi:MAG TPA: hypothetical protein VF171_09200 [Trueperaceae bacterium]